ncbi:Patellin-3 [Forsythia ovata]|uniref:Patellin-3 n=1 Tax=Forsythia ovata TaxID=205694 RepID=A0ABD1SIN9_9LAMI
MNGEKKLSPISPPPANAGQSTTAGQSVSTEDSETLRPIPEQILVQYSDLSRKGEQEFAITDRAIEEFIKPTSKHTIEFPITKQERILVWEVRVVGWNISYGAEFVPNIHLDCIEIEEDWIIRRADNQLQLHIWAD